MFFFESLMSKDERSFLRLQVNETTSRVVAGIMDLRINGIADRAKSANSQQLTSMEVATRRLVVS